MRKLLSRLNKWALRQALRLIEALDYLLDPPGETEFSPTPKLVSLVVGQALSKSEVEELKALIIFHEGYARGMRENCFVTRDPLRDEYALERAKIHESWGRFLRKVQAQIK